MLELLQSIKGPQFLIIYFLYCSILIILCRFLINRDNQRDQENTIQFDLDTYSTAVLANHKNLRNLAETVVAELWTQKYIEAIEYAGKVRLRKTDKPLTGLSAVQREFIDALTKPADFKTLFSNRILMGRLKQVAANTKNELVRMNLLKDSKTIKRESRIRGFFFLAMLTLGVLKAMMGFANHKPVAYLVIELILATCIFFLVNKKVYITQKGKRYLGEKGAAVLRTNGNQSHQGLLGGQSNAVMTVALFGIASVYSYPEFGMLSRVTQFPNHGSSGCTTSGCASSGCGGSDGGGSGCSGGGCGGGGCGGCGGS